MDVLWVSLVALFLMAPRQVQANTTSPAVPWNITHGGHGNTSAEPGLSGEGSIRLVNGSSRCSGAVEVHHHGRWMPVCQEMWDKEASHVVCRQLHCGEAKETAAEPTPSPVCPPRSTPTKEATLSSQNLCPSLHIHCVGLESTWKQCNVSELCCSKKQVSVTCTGSHSVRLVGGGSCCEGRVEVEADEHQKWRLSGGKDVCAGRVEVYYRGVWNTVCDGAWYKEEMGVLCRWLGCSPSGRKLSFNYTQEGRMNYQCSGTEPSLSWCQWHYNNFNLCHQSQAAGVICNGSLGLLNTSAVPPTEMMNPDTGRSTAEPPCWEAKALSNWTLLLLCVILGLLLLVTVLAFTAALLRMRRKHAHTVASSSLATPVLVNHSAQGPETPAGGANDYRKAPPKAEAAPLAVPAPGSEDSDSDYEHYDFSSKPPVALSTFYNSLRHRAADETLPASGFPPAPGQEVLNEGQEPWGQPEQRPYKGSRASWGANACSLSPELTDSDGVEEGETKPDGSPAASIHLLGLGGDVGEVLEIDSEQKLMGTMELYCQGNGADLRNCHLEKSNCTRVLTVVCKEPEKTTTAPPPPTTPEPTGPPRLQLVDGRFHCSGIVELYMGGHLGTVQSSPENEIKKLARWVCPKVGCGDALDQKEWPFFMKNESQHLPVHWEMVASCRSDSIPDCFKRTRNSQDKTPASVICSGFQPRIMQRLGDSQSPCEGVMEVFHKGKWEVLCDSSPWRKSRGQQVCQELQCGNLSSSVQVQDAKTWGVSCSKQHLQQCPTFQRATCSETRVTCQNFKPRSAGVGAGTIVSILLALILLGVLIVICGPPAYKKLQKKCT
ncbi:T-cell differentiation antigen CD6 [Platysternon megacephalum]|uniref:T-cell differentiation antigen CD6 n=1 Tax=Platysternon megacephalum TaxID=55544 RepID=A0A4D9DKA1_9SAUR|nr:T-cell differentiation antigen CD6 [Platysternon megacephalum]